MPILSRWSGCSFDHWSCHTPVCQHGERVASKVSGTSFHIYVYPEPKLLSSGIRTKELIQFFLYFLLYASATYFVPMRKLQLYMYPSIVVTSVTIFGKLRWALHADGGTVISSDVVVTVSAKAFLFMQCTSSNAAVWISTGDRFADWTRFARNKYVPIPAVITGFPILATASAIIEALTTSALY